VDLVQHLSTVQVDMVHQVTLETLAILHKHLVVFLVDMD
jgi:hypothetical protein